MSNRYKVNAPNVVQELVDGEVVIVNLLNGSYYSTENIGAGLWTAVIGGHEIADIATAACRYYGADEA